MYKKMTQWILGNALWWAAIGLALSSSGLDGAYMAAWMPVGAGWLGYVLNTVSDFSGMAIVYYYGRIQQTQRNVPGGKRKIALSRGLLGAEVITVGYSWFLSWRRLCIVLPAIEPQDWRWIAPIAAGFIPSLLAFIGYTQALLAGRIESEVNERAPKAKMQSEVERISAKTKTQGRNGNKYVCPYCDKVLGSPQALSAHLRWCDAYQAQKEPQCATL